MKKNTFKILIDDSSYSDNKEYTLSEKYNINTEINNLKINNTNKKNIITSNFTLVPNNINDSSNNEKCIIIFAYNRPYYLYKVLNALVHCQNIEEWHIIYLQDGPTHADTKKIAEFVLPKIKCKSLEKIYYVLNKGIAIIQYIGLCYAFMIKKYKYIVHLEDDLVISPTYLKSIENLLDFTENDNNIAYVSCSYKNIGNDHRLIIDLIGSIHSWGIGISRKKFLEIEPLYSKATELLYLGYNYKNLHFIKEKIYNIRKNILQLDQSNIYTQDGTLNLCWKKHGFKNVIYSALRHSLPIGEIGSHFNKKIFKEMSLDSTTIDYIHPIISIESDYEKSV